MNWSTRRGGRPKTNSGFPVFGAVQGGRQAHEVRMLVCSFTSLSSPIHSGQSQGVPTACPEIGVLKARGVYRVRAPASTQPLPPAIYAEREEHLRRSELPRHGER